MNDPAKSILESTTAIIGEMFGLPPHTDTAPNEAHYADRATWLCACDVYERKINMAAGEATCGDPDEQEAAFARYMDARLGIKT